MIEIRLFDGVEKPFVWYNGKAVIDMSFSFFVEDCEDGSESEEEDFTFQNYVSAYMRVYNERDGSIIKTYTPVRYGSNLILNVNPTDATFEDLGLYYYEVGYVITGGYEQVLSYGKFTVI